MLARSFQNLMEVDDSGLLVVTMVRRFRVGATGSFVLGEQSTEFSTFTLDFIRNFDFRRNLEERLSDCVGLCKIDGLSA